MSQVPLTPEHVEQLRRAIVMLRPRQPSGLDREAAVAILEELQRLQARDRRLMTMVVEVKRLLEEAG